MLVARHNGGQLRLERAELGENLIEPLSHVALLAPPKLPELLVLQQGLQLTDSTCQILKSRIVAF